MKKKILILVFWLVVWQLISLLVNNDIMLVGPIETILALGNLIVLKEFYLSIISTTLKIILGFLCGFVLACIFAYLSYKSEFIEDIISPIISILKSVPIVSVVILLLIWLGNNNLSLFISMTVVFPQIYLALLAGLKNVDKQLLEVSKVFEMRFANTFKYIVWPTIYKHLYPSLSLSLGMSWKSSIASEVIGQPLNTIGNQLYKSKIFLQTSNVFAWTLVIILLSWLFEKCILYLFRKIGGFDYEN